MKKYQVWVQYTNVSVPENYQYEVWKQLNETDSLEEAYEWYLTAKRQKDKYSVVRITKHVEIEIREV